MENLAASARKGSSMAAPQAAFARERRQGRLQYNSLVKSSLEAVYQNGVFRPVDPPGLPEGERVRLTVERVGQATPDDILKLASRVYEGLSRQDIDEIEELARHRALFDDVH